MIFFHYPKDNSTTVEAVEAVYRQLKDSELEPWAVTLDTTPGASMEEAQRDTFFQAGYWVIFSESDIDESEIEHIAASYHRYHRPFFLAVVYMGCDETRYEGPSFHHTDAEGTAARLKNHLDLALHRQKVDQGISSSVSFDRASAVFLQGVFMGGDLSEVPKIDRFPARLAAFHWTRAPLLRELKEAGTSEKITLSAENGDDPSVAEPPRSLVDIAARARADLKSGRYAQVQDDADLLRKREPRWEMGWFLEGLCALKQNEPIRARFYFAVARLLAPESFLVAYHHAITRSWMGDLAEGIEELQMLCRSKAIMNHCVTARFQDYPETDSFAERFRQDPRTKDAFKDFVDFLKSIDSARLERLARTPETPGNQPLHLCNFSIGNFQRFKLAFDDLEGFHPWIFLTGDNGEGKTSLLQALAIGLAGPLETSEPGIETDIGVCLRRGDGLLVTGEYHHRHGILRYGVGICLGYGPSRLQLNSFSRKTAATQLSQPVHSLLNLDQGLLNIEDHLLSLHNRRNALAAEVFDLQRNESLSQNDRIMLDQKEKAMVRIDQAIDRIKGVLIELLPRVEEIRFSSGEGKGEIRVLYLEKGKDIPFKQLSAGHQAMIALAGDIMIRLMMDQPGKPFDQLEGLVLIDELENHLHVSRQYRLPRQLSKVFPRVQFIASTHSPIPLLGAPPDSVIWLIDHDQDGNATLERQNVALNRLHPNNVLSSPVFGFDGFLDHTDMGRLETVDDYEEIARKKQLDKYLQWAEKNVTLPDELFQE